MHRHGQGRPPGPKQIDEHPMRPFGYETDRYTVRDDEAEMIRDAARRLIDGESLSSIERDWNERGFRTTGGNLWNQGVLRRALKSLRVQGKERLPDGTTVKARWPAIIDELTARKVGDILADHSRAGVSPPRSRSYLLSGGLATCGICGKWLFVKFDKKRVYVCTSRAPIDGCGKIRINADLVEDEVAVRLIARLIRPDSRDVIANLMTEAKREAKTAEDDLSAAKSRLSEIGEEFAKGRITAETMHGASQRLDADIKHARRTIRSADALDHIAVLEAPDLIKWWEGASLDQQRALLAILVKEICVMPAPVRGSRTFAPERVQVRWK